MPERAGSQPTRVLHVLGRLTLGGTETRMMEVIRTLPPGAVVSDFCVLSGLPGEYDDEVRELGGDMHYLRCNMMFPIRLRQLLRRGNYHVVHAYIHLSSGAVLRLARSVGIGVRIANFRATGDGRGNGVVRRAWRALNRRWIDRHATAIVAVSQAAMEAAWPDYAGDPRCRVIHNGVELRRFSRPEARVGARSALGVAPGQRLVLHVGNQKWEKNHERVVAVFLALLERRPGTLLAFVGQEQSVTADRIATMVRTAAAEGQVRTLGSRTDVPDLMFAADAMLLPSHREGLAGVLLEAAAAALPVVASDIPPNREAAELVPGITVLPLSLPDHEWASTLDRVLSQPRARVADNHDQLRRRGITADATSLRYLELWGADR